MSKRIFSVFGIRSEAIQIVLVTLRMGVKRSVASVDCAVTQYRGVQDLKTSMRQISVDCERAWVSPNQGGNDVTARASDSLFCEFTEARYQGSPGWSYPESFQYYFGW